MTITVLRPGTHVVPLGIGLSVISSGGAPAGNGLLNNLITYSAGNELNGDRLDLHVNALHLTDVNTVTSNPGWPGVYANSRQYTAANNEYHTRPGDDALLSTGDIDFTLATCVYQDSKPGASMAIAGKDNNGVNTREYLGVWDQPTDRYRWIVRDGNNIIGDVNAVTLGAPVLATWYLIVCWHDAVANTVSIQVNNGGVDAAATTGAPADTAGIFRISWNQAGFDWDGRIGPTMFWKSGPGLGGVKTPAERLAFWNGGVPLTYAAFTV